MIIYERMKRQKISKKGTLELQKDRRSTGYRCPNVFLELFRPNIFLMNFGK